MSADGAGDADGAMVRPAARPIGGAGPDPPRSGASDQAGGRAPGIGDVDAAVAAVPVVRMQGQYAQSVRAAPQWSSPVARVC